MHLCLPSPKAQKSFYVRLLFTMIVLKHLIGMHLVFHCIFQLFTIFWIPILSFKIFETPSSLMVFTNLISICTLSHCPHYWKYWRQNKSLQNSVHGLPPLKNRIIWNYSLKAVFRQFCTNLLEAASESQLKFRIFISTAFPHPKGLLHWHERELLRLSSIYFWEICINSYS